MKHTLLLLLLVSLATCTQATAQSARNQGWIGIWHAHADGQTTGALTLAADTGKIGGTIVLDMIQDENGTPQVIAREPYLLMNPHLKGNTLSFQVKMKMHDGRAVMRDFTVTVTSPGNADIHCMNCGPDAPVVKMTRDR